MAQRKAAGIIGGMGPEATVDLMHRVIRSTPARDDVDHVRMIVDNNPQVPSRIKALIEGTGESPVLCLREMATKLESHGADFLAMPCNTAHAYYDDIASVVSIPMLHMIRLTAAAVAASLEGKGNAGILASDAVINSSLYEGEFRNVGVSVLYPRRTPQDDLMDAIKEIKTGETSAPQRAALRAAAKDLIDRGASALVVACTELSVVADILNGFDRVFDASQVLAEAIVSEASGYSMKT